MKMAWLRAPRRVRARLTKTLKPEWPQPGSIANPSRYLSRPLEASVYWYQFTFAAAVVWGFALLPGGLTVALIGIVGSLGLYLGRHLHRAAQLILLPAEALPPLAPPSDRYRSAMRMMLLLLLLTFFDLPLRANAILCRPAALQVFDTVPIDELPLNHRWIGLTFAKRINADVTGVRIAVFGGGGFVYEFSSATQRLEYRDLYQARKDRIFRWSNHARG